MNAVTYPGWPYHPLLDMDDDTPNKATPRWGKCDDCAFLNPDRRGDYCAGTGKRLTEAQDACPRYQRQR